jgi:hypothetical protein
MPIGQVFFVPREEVTMRPCDSDEQALILEARTNFFKEKAAHNISTPYGLQFSPHYLQQSRLRKT